MESIVDFLNRFKKHLLIISVSLLLIRCASSVPLQPSTSDLTVAQSHWQNTTMDQLTAGYNLYTTKCDNEDCHGLKEPQKFSEKEWTSILPKMGRKAHLDSTQYAEVYRYILAKRESIANAKK